MKIYKSICKNCNREFDNKSGQRQRPSVHCSYGCRRKYIEKIRKENGYYAKRRKDPVTGSRIKEQSKLWARNNYDKIRAWQEANPEKTKVSKGIAYLKYQGYSEEFYFARQEAKKRDLFACQDCGNNEEKSLIVHHLDEDKKNNELENLVTLCRSCHGKRHKKNILAVRYIRGVNYI